MGSTSVWLPGGRPSIQRAGADARGAPEESGGRPTSLGRPGAAFVFSGWLVSTAGRRIPSPLLRDRVCIFSWSGRGLKALVVARGPLSLSLLPWVFVLCAAPLPTWAYEGAVRHDEPADAGIHVPVLTRAPELLHFVDAVYPEEAKALQLDASVKMAITIGADGSVTDVQVLEPAGHGFDEAAVAAVKQFQFSPAEVDGVPAPVQIEYVYNFRFTLPPDAGTPETDGGVAVDAGVPTSTLTGQLIARGSRHRVQAALVRCGDDPDAAEALSDEDGRFTLVTSAGGCDVKVAANGFQLFQTHEELPPNGTLEVRYFLMPEVVGYQTVVRGQREKKEVVRRTLERQELQKVPGTFGDPVRVIQNFPGVARMPFGLGQLIVRGAAPDDTKTMFDGVEIPLLFHLGGGPSVVNAEFLDRVDFYPGGFGSRYGRAIGGIVDVATRKGASDTWHGSVKVDLLDTSVFLEAPVVDGVSAAVAARRSYVDALLPFVLPEDPEGGTLLVLPRYWDYQVRVDFGAKRGEDLVPGRPQNRFYVMAFGSDDTLQVVATGGGRNRDVSLDVETLFHRMKGDWTWRFGKMTSVFAPYAGYDKAGLAFGEADLDLDRYNLGAREDFELDLDEHLVMRAGFDLQFQHLVAHGEVPVVSGFQVRGWPGAEPKTEMEDFERTFNAFDGAGYLEADLKFGPFSITPGIRASQSRIHGQYRHMEEPRLFVRFQPTDRFALKASAGLYTQPPDAATLEPAPLGSPFLVHEKAFQTSLGFEQRFTDAIHLDVTGYYNRRYDLIVSPGPIEVHPDGSREEFQYANEGLGRAYGLEVLLRHDITERFFGWIAYTLNRSEARRAGSPRDYVLTSFDQTHILTAVGSYRLPWGFEVGARFRYVTGSPTTPLVHEYDQYSAETNRFRVARGEPNSVRQPPFHQLDLRIDKNWLFESWTLDTYVDVQNVYNAQNVEATYTDYRGRVEYEVPGIPILPVIGVKGTF
ncbi:MAG: TonB-dependent receptor [Myxococcaceae bacterium]|nr:TonB-dependent receptor [Myxococcaceae bacterium]